MISMQNPLVLLALIIIGLLAFFIKKSKSNIENIFAKDVLNKIQNSKHTISKQARMYLFLISMSFAVIALSRPYIFNKDIKVSSSFVNIITAIDMSKSMFANDVYPNRFEFAKEKFFDLLHNAKDSKIALIGFSSSTFLISPLTEDFNSLKFLVKNLSTDNISLKGTSIIQALKTSNELFDRKKKKILLLLTDGGDSNSFDEEIAYAKKHNILVYVYNIGTHEGGAIKNKYGILKDKAGHIVISSLNENIKDLAFQSGGAYLTYSLNKNDIKLITENIKSKFENKNKKDKTIKDTRELFYYPLMLSIIFLFLSFFSMPQKKEV